MPAQLRAALTLLLRPVQFVVYALAGLVPRDPLMWAFGTWNGQRFADNAAALFLHLDAHPRPGVRRVWITRRREIRDSLRRDGHRVHLAWSPMGVWCGLRSGVYVYDSIPRDLNFWLSRGARLVLLRHGIGIKTSERAIDVPGHRIYEVFHGRGLSRLFWRTAIPWHLPVPDLVIACSPEHADLAPRLFGVARDRVVITGFPRHDQLAQPSDCGRTAIPTIDEPVPADRPAIIYLPTFREGFRSQRFPWPVLQRAAEDADVTIAVKLHPVDAQRGVQSLRFVYSASHLRLIEPSVDPVSVYPCADGMITDFSSAAFDFLLLDRPIIHFVPDYEEFVRHRSLLYALDEVALGPICRNGGDLTTALKDARATNGSRYAARRHALKARFYTFPPGGASERVASAISTLVEPRLRASGATSRQRPARGHRAR